MFIAVYLDDILIFSQKILQLKEFQSVLIARFCMTDLEEVLQYHDITIDINPDKAEIRLKQTIYPRKILQMFNIQNSHPISTSIEPEIQN